MKFPVPEQGDVFEFPYPFVRDTYTEFDEEGSAEVPTWKPGTRMVPVYDDCRAVADAMGKQIVTVVGTFKPGRFPLRVFYTRQWVDPDGKIFGKANCRFKTFQCFRALLNGYSKEYTLNGKAMHAPGSWQALLEASA